MTPIYTRERIDSYLYSRVDRSEMDRVCRMIDGFASACCLILSTIVVIVIIIVLTADGPTLRIAPNDTTLNDTTPLAADGPNNTCVFNQFASSQANLLPSQILRNVSVATDVIKRCDFYGQYLAAQLNYALREQQNTIPDRLHFLQNHLVRHYCSIPPSIKCK